jgi:hypothetical protein
MQLHMVGEGVRHAEGNKTKDRSKRGRLLQRETKGPAEAGEAQADMG